DQTTIHHFNIGVNHLAAYSTVTPAHCMGSQHHCRLDNFFLLYIASTGAVTPDDPALEFLAVLRINAHPGKFPAACCHTIDSYIVTLDLLNQCTRLVYASFDLDAKPVLCTMSGYSCNIVDTEAFAPECNFVHSHLQIQVAFRLQSTWFFLISWPATNAS